MTVAKVQHYVPQFLLRNFGTGKKDQVFVFDKHMNKSFPTNAKNVASESRFYDFTLNGEAMTLEPMLSKLESKAKPAIEKIIQADCLTSLDNETKIILADFFSVQLVRTRAFQEQFGNIPKMMRERLGIDSDQLQDNSQAAEFLQDLSENDLKIQRAQFIINAPQDFSQRFLDKVWVLASTSRQTPFILGDHPIALQNKINRDGWGNLGLAVEGIEIYFPLTPTRALALWCPTQVQKVYDSAYRLSQMPRWMWHDKIESADEILNLAEKVHGGLLVPYKPENVKNINSLQIFWSERYLFSNVNEFELVKEIIEKNPESTRGMRMRTN